MKPWNIEVEFLFNLAVLFGIFIKIVSEKLCNNEEMLFVVEEINEFEQVFGIKIAAVSLDISQEFDFIDALIEIVLVVFNDFHANHLFSVDIITLNSL